MHLAKSKLLLLTLLSGLASAQMNESILSQERIDLFDMSEQQNIENSAKLKKDWINPVTYTYSQVNGETYTTEKSFISVNQPLFKSGGIYSAIRYANALERYNHLDIEMQRKALIKDATSLLFQINIANLNMKKQELLLKNAQIDVERKKEQVMNGFLDTSFLDNAILEANLRKNALLDLQFQKEQLILNFNTLASGEYTNFTLPKFAMMDEDQFINSNLNIAKSKEDIQSKYRFKNMTIARYLPTLNGTYDYTKYHDTDNNPSITSDSTENYGFNVQIPLDVRSLNEIESTKIEYLKSKITEETTKLEESNFFKTKRARIKMLQEKAKIAQSDYELYNSLLEVIVEEANAGLKTQSDVDTLQNSQKVKELELKIHQLDEQIELLELYAKIG